MISYTYLFTAIFLWLGFWLKCTIHTIFNYPYPEAMGTFFPSGDSMDGVLLVATIGCWGVMCARFFLSLWKFKSTVYVPSDKVFRAPEFYINNRGAIILAVITLIIITAILNVIYGINQSGLVPEVRLIWPLNALVYWSLGIGFALLLTNILWWESLYEKKSMSIFVCALVEPFVSSISILSRATYIFHFLPVFIAFLINKKRLRIRVSNLQILGVILLCAILFVISIKTVSCFRRDKYYIIPSAVDVMPPVFNKSSYPEKKATQLRVVPPIFNKSSYPEKKTTQLRVVPPIFNILSELVIDRWIGMEGVMAISSYPQKNVKLLKDALIEKSVIGKIGMYQFIAHAHYTQMDTARYTFGTMPGPIGFFYYSGYLLIVFLGMFIFTSIMILSEFLVCYLGGNYFLNSLYGMYAAGTIAQFGVIPTVLLKQYLMIFLLMLIFRISKVKTKQEKTE